MLSFIDRIQVCRPPTQSEVRGSVYFIWSINPIIDQYIEAITVLLSYLLLISLLFFLFHILSKISPSIIFKY